MNKEIKSISTPSKWVFCFTLVLSVFTFSGLTPSPKTNQQRATQTEQTVSIPQVNKRTASFNLFLRSTPLDGSDRKCSFALLQFNREVKTKLQSNAFLQLSFQKSDLASITYLAPAYPEELCVHS